MVDLQRLELLKKTAQRAERGEPHLRVGSRRVPRQPGRILHTVNNC